MTHEVRGVDVEKYALLCQQTSPKLWFGNMEMTSNCDVTNSTPNTNDHHMTLNQNPRHENFLRTPLYMFNEHKEISRINAIVARQCVWPT